MACQTSLRAPRNTDLQRTYVVSANGAPYDLTGWSAAFYVRTAAGQTPSLSLTATPTANGSSVQITSTSEAMLALVVTQADLATLPLGSPTTSPAVLVYDLVLTGPTGLKTRFAVGSFIVDPEGGGWWVGEDEQLSFNLGETEISLDVFGSSPSIELASATPAVVADLAVQGGLALPNTYRFNVMSRAYGAVGDNVADDTIALNNAHIAAGTFINAIQSALTSNQYFGPVAHVYMPGRIPYKTTGPVMNMRTFYTITNAVWTNSGGGSMTYTVSDTINNPSGKVGQRIHSTEIVGTGGLGLPLHGADLLVTACTAHTFTVTFLAASSPGTYVSGGRIGRAFSAHLLIGGDPGAPACINAVGDFGHSMVVIDPASPINTGNIAVQDLSFITATATTKGAHLYLKSLNQSAVRRIKVQGKFRGIVFDSVSTTRCDDIFALDGSEMAADTTTYSPTSVTVIGGSGYSVGDTVTTDAGNGAITTAPTLRCMATSPLTFAIIDPGIFTTKPTNACAQATTSGGGSGATFAYGWAHAYGLVTPLAASTQQGTGYANNDLVPCLGVATISGTAQAGGASSITLASTASAVDSTYVNSFIYITTGTGIGQCKQITAYNGTTKVATVASAWTTQPTSASGYEVAAVGEYLDNGTAQAGGGSTITLRTGASSVDSFYNGNWVWIASGTGLGQWRKVSSYVGSTRVATMASSWTTNPDNTSVYVVCQPTIVQVTAVTGATGMSTANLYEAGAYNVRPTTATSPYCFAGPPITGAGVGAMWFVAFANLDLSYRAGSAHIYITSTLGLPCSDLWFTKLTASGTDGNRRVENAIYIDGADVVKFDQVEAGAVAMAALRINEIAGLSQQGIQTTNFRADALCRYGLYASYTSTGGGVNLWDINMTCFSHDYNHVLIDMVSMFGCTFKITTEGCGQEAVRIKRCSGVVTIQPTCVGVGNLATAHKQFSAIKLDPSVADIIIQAPNLQCDETYHQNFGIYVDDTCSGVSIGPGSINPGSSGTARVHCALANGNERSRIAGNDGAPMFDTPGADTMIAYVGGDSKLKVFDTDGTTVLASFRSTSGNFITKGTQTPSGSP